MASIVTLGFPGKVVTLGFASGASVAINRESLEWQALPSRMQFTSQRSLLQYQSLPSQLHYRAEEES